MTGADWRLALTNAGVDPDPITTILRSTVGLPPDCPVLLAGSIADGLAVRSSDIDLFAICTRQDLQGGLLSGRDHVSVACGERRLDVTLLDPDELRALIARLAAFCACQPPSNTQADNFSIAERIRLHRVATGLPVAGFEAIAAFKAAIADHHLRLKRHCALEMIKRRKYSAQALAETGDHRNLLFICRDIVDETADLLLAAAGDGSVALKWRMGRLRRAYPADGNPGTEDCGPGLWPALHDPAETYFRLSHFPLDDRLGPSLDYARQVTGWADLVVLWSSAAGRISDSDLALGQAAASRAALNLRLDCSLVSADDAFLLQLLNSAQPGWEVSPQAAAFIAHLNQPLHTHPANGAASREPEWDTGALLAFLRDQGFASALDAVEERTPG